MESTADFVFEPLPPIEEPATSAVTKATTLEAAAAADALGRSPGSPNWTGQGFNVIWRPPAQASGRTFLGST